MKIKSISKLKEFLKVTSRTDNKTFDISQYYLRDAVNPYLALVRRRNFNYMRIDNVKYLVYRHYNNLNNTRFLVDSNDEDTLCKITFDDFSHRHQSNFYRLNQHLHKQERLNKFIVDNLDESVEHNFYELPKLEEFNIEYEFTHRCNRKITALTKEDAIKEISFHESLPVEELKIINSSITERDS